MRAKPAAQLAVGATLAIKRSKTSVSKAQRRVQEHVQIDERETPQRSKGKPAHALPDEEVFGAQIIVAGEIALAIAAAPARCRLRRQRR
jgi:hypothetical protein